MHRRDTLRAQEFLVKNLTESGIPVLWNTEIKDILGEERVTEVELFNNQTNGTSNMPVDGVFLSIGYTPAVELASKIGLELTEEGYIARDCQAPYQYPRDLRGRRRGRGLQADRYSHRHGGRGRHDHI